MSNAAITGATALVAAILFHPRLSRSKDWRAIVTPLASIIGSGFLVIGPILNASFGYMVPAAMAALCGVAYLFGAGQISVTMLGQFSVTSNTPASGVGHHWPSP